MRGPSLISLTCVRRSGGRPASASRSAALLRDPIFRGDGMADGRGRPVLLIPGFLAGDGSLADGRMAQAGRLQAQPRRDRLERELRGRADPAARGPARAARLAPGTAGRDRGPEPRRHARQGAGAPAARPGRRRGGARVAADRPARSAPAGAAPGRGRRAGSGSLGAPGSSSARASTATAARRSGGPRPAAAATGFRSCRCTRRATASWTGAPASTRTPPARRDQSLPLRDGGVESAWRARRRGAGELPPRRADRRPAARHASPGAPPARGLSRLSAHRRTADPRRLRPPQPIERLVRLLQRERLHLRAHRHLGASSRNSSASARVRFATERSTRSPQSSS